MLYGDFARKFAKGLLLYSGLSSDSFHGFITVLLPHMPNHEKIASPKIDINT